jgi:hypothetical protein
LAGGWLLLLQPARTRSTSSRC